MGTAPDRDYGDQPERLAGWIFSQAHPALWYALGFELLVVGLARIGGAL